MTSFRAVSGFRAEAPGSARPAYDRVFRPAIPVTGVVERGDRRGRLLGFPTANVLGVDGVPLDGVYAGTAQIDPDTDGPVFVAAVSVGHRPTYYGKDGVRLLEAHLLNFRGDLYGRRLRVELHVRLRPQHKYVDSRSLIRQLRTDVEETRSWALGTGMGSLVELRHRRGHRRRRGRWGSAPRTGAHDRSTVALRRALRRAELIAEAVRSAPPGGLDHAWVAQRTGLPHDYLRWMFPTLEQLAAAAPGDEGHAG